MPLPNDFAFSQAALADYLDCKRRFQYRYLKRLAWPAIEAEPAQVRERRMLQGQAFHRWLQRFFTGLPQESLEAALSQDATLERWWQAFKAYPIEDLPPQRQAEVRLSANLAGFRLQATLDLVAVQPGERAVIVDWKTGSRGGDPTVWAERVQTSVYRYLMLRSGAFLNAGQDFQADQIEMLYWFAEAPAEALRLPYDQEQYEADEARLQGLIQEINAASEDDFPLTDQLRRCAFCVYRSLCQRGEHAGSLEDQQALDVEVDAEFDLDFDQIAEIAF